jgi:hypothetical protein
LAVTELFYDGLPDPEQRREVLHRRTQQQAEERAAYEERGRQMDALRQAEELIQVACGISIDKWSDDKLQNELMRLGKAYALLESEGR